jgi:hypothetical protein
VEPLLLLKSTFQNRYPDGLSLMLPHEEHNNTPPIGQSQGKLINTSKVDWDFIGHWLCDCDAKHPECTSRDLHEQPLEGFHIIDCETRNIGSLPPGSDYACLSYVWGSPSPMSTAFET